jgi:hypothetical protein
MKKKLASVSLDLDNQWSYMKIHGDKGWESYPSYYSIFVPYVLDVLNNLDLKISFFIVGKDAAMDENKAYVQEIAKKGHEISNHSFNHESWIHKYSEKELRREIDLSHTQLEKLTGLAPIGFRGPGFSWSVKLLEVLESYGYTYDASTLPTWIGPLARKYYFMTANLSKEEKKDRSELFGTFKDGRRPVKPYLWKLPNDKSILELPVSTIPILKTPFHLSYLLYLSGYSMILMKAYLNTAIQFCKLTHTEPSFLLHPLDLIGGDQISDLAFFPGMNISSDHKVKVFKQVIKTLSKNFTIVNMRDHAATLLANKDIKVRIP